MQKGFTAKPRQRRAKQEAGFIPILIAILIAALGGYLLYQKFSPSQIYANPALGYGFIYPKGWRVNSFQNKDNYNLGITVVNEKDQEIFTLYDSLPPIWIGCENFPDTIKVQVPVGEQNTTILLNNNGKTVNTCKTLTVKTLFGKKFNMEFRYFNTKSTNQAVDVLKSIKGLTITQ